LNGVSLSRVNQIYVIATSTKLDLSSSNFDKFDDKFFKRVRTPKKNAEKDIFNTQQQVILVKNHYSSSSSKTFVILLSI